MKIKEKDNTILTTLAKADQSDRALFRLREITFEILKKNDEERLFLVEKEMSLGKLKTIQDYRNAGLIFHHSRIKNNYCRRMAVKCLQKSVDLDNYSSIGIKWLLAATIDRELMEQNKAQVYGTQYVQNEEGKYELYKLNLTKISDKEREDYGVLKINEQAKKVELMNRKQLVDLYVEKGNIESILDYCKENYENSSRYDLSWKGLSQFSFHIKRAGKIEESQKIFELAIELYPKEYDLYHSLGLLYEETGRREKAIELIEKSILLNPKFEEGKNDLKRLKKK